MPSKKWPQDGSIFISSHFLPEIPTQPHLSAHTDLVIPCLCTITQFFPLFQHTLTQPHKFYSDIPSFGKPPPQMMHPHLQTPVLCLSLSTSLRSLRGGLFTLLDHLKCRASLRSDIWHVVGIAQYLLREIPTNKAHWCTLLRGEDHGAGTRNFTSSFIIIFIRHVEFHRTYDQRTI